MLHEFILSGIYFRTYWANPVGLILIFLFIGLGMRSLSRGIQKLIIVTLFILLSLQIRQNLSALEFYKSPQNYFSHKKAQIYCLNPHSWMDTVTKTTEFLEKNLSKDEYFFALPYDPIYYFLTDHQSPTRQLVFFKFTNIPEQQQLDVIHDLESHKVNWILISNRYESYEQGFGVFGLTHCTLLAHYIDQNFKQVAQFGDWTNEGGWVENHGTRIYKRISK